MFAHMDDDFDYDYGEVPDLEQEPPVEIDQSRADRMLATRARLLAEQETVMRLAAEKIGAVMAWRDQRVGTVDRQVRWLDTALAGFARMMRKRTGNARTSLPSGWVQASKARWSVEVFDEPALRAWAAEHDVDVFTSPQPPVSKTKIVGAFERPGMPAVDGEVRYQEFVTKDGEIVPGVRYVADASGVDVSIHASTEAGL